MRDRDEDDNDEGEYLEMIEEEIEKRNYIIFTEI